MTTTARPIPPVPPFSNRYMATGRDVPNKQTSNLQLSNPDQLAERTRVFVEFLDSQRSSTDHLEYKEKIRSMLRRGDTRLIVNINDVRNFHSEYCYGLLTQPMDYLYSFDDALREMVNLMIHGEPDLPWEDLNKVFFHVGLDGAFGDHHINPRTLSTNLLSQLVCIEAIVTSCFLVRPKLVKSVHYAEKTNSFISREYRDATMTSNYIPISNAYPTEDADGNILSTEYGYCVYRDCQKIVIQEIPERAPPGQLPRSIDVLLMDDLVDRAKPGDRIQLVAIYKSLASIANGQVPPTFRTILLANNISALGKESSQPLLTDIDIQHIKQLSKRQDIFELLSRSLAPSIFGHEYIKKAILLMLLGGVEKNLENTHIRGDINILLVGDPSTAKSQMLRFVLNTAHLAIATTGRGSSGVGLTAAVMLDKETGERRLEAGAMVLADRGIVCIDEFDKMSDIDRVAIHEVMEQQTVTIAKAGIHLSLNARCSVLAAANPIWGQYRESCTPQENIRLPDSLLSRFDLLFIVLDTMNERHDRHIAKHVTNMHRYLPPGVEEGTVINNDNYNIDQGTEEETLETSIFQKMTRIFDDEDDSNQKSDCLTIAFIKKYIHYARVRMKPILTQPAIDTIRRVYNEFRSKKEEEEINAEKTLPVTPRTLETLIRLSTAHAKSRLSMTVDEQDALIAEELVRYCLYKEVKKQGKIKKRRGNDVVNQEMKELEIVDDEEIDDDLIDDNIDDIVDNIDNVIDSSKPTFTQEMISTVKSGLLRLRSKNQSEGFFPISLLMEELAGAEISFAQVEAILGHMEQTNMIMYREQTIIFL